MKTFAITPDNNVTLYASKQEAEAAKPEATFASLEDFVKVAVDWPSSRLIELWNSIPGMTPVKKFTSRDIAMSRIWRALQQLDGDRKPGAEPEAEPASEKQPKAASTKKDKPADGKKRAAKDAKPDGARGGTKKATILELVGRKNGATLEELMEATQWQAHSVRGFISNLIHKADYEIESVKRETGERAYILRK